MVLTINEINRLENKSRVDRELRLLGCGIFFTIMGIVSIFGIVIYNINKYEEDLN